MDVATYVAKKLGYEENQIEWKESKSADRETMLQRGDVDFIAATYSITPERQEKVDFAGPYLLAHQDVLLRADDDKIKSPEDLNDARLCSVTGSTSAQNVKEKLAPKAQLQNYPTYSACLTGLQNGAIDALTTDDSILAGYASQSQFKGKFKLGGFKMTNENYGIGVKKGSDLKDKINKALEEMVADGSWDTAVKENFGPANYKNEPRRRSATSRAEAGPDGARRPRGGGGAPGRASLHAEAREIVFDFLQDYDLAGAVWTTVQLAVLSAVGSLIWGTVLAAMRVGPVPLMRGFGTAYVNIVRNIPLTVIILFASLGLNQTLQITLGGGGDFETINFRLAVLGLTLYTSAFVCEALRSGINTVPVGQAEAARAIGLSFGQVLRHVVLPQAFRSSVVPLANVLIALIKNTTVAAAIGVAETALVMKEMIENEAQLLLISAIIALVFVVLTLPTGLFLGWVGKKVAVKR